MTISSSNAHLHIASFPGLPRFYFPFAFTIIHGSRRPVFWFFINLPILCITVNAKARSKWGRPGTEANLHIHLIVTAIFTLHCIMRNAWFTQSLLTHQHQRPLPQAPCMSSPSAPCEGSISSRSCHCHKLSNIHHFLNVCVLWVASESHLTCYRLSIDPWLRFRDTVSFG